jgi:hypothetical protein
LNLDDVLKKFDRRIHGVETKIFGLEQNALLRDSIEGQIKVFAVLYEKSNAYANLIIVAGYAGFFALWSLTRPYLSTRAALIAAALMALSLALFIFSEVFKMVLMSNASTRRAKLLHSEPSQQVEVFVQNLKAIENTNSRDALRFALWWPWVLFPTIAFGLAAAGTLVASLICGLIHELNH